MFSHTSPGAYHWSSASKGPPNGLRVSRAAHIDRDNLRMKTAFKIATILGPRSGVGCTRRLGGSRLGISRHRCRRRTGWPISTLKYASWVVHLTLDHTFSGAARNIPHQLAVRAE